MNATQLELDLLFMYSLARCTWYPPFYTFSNLGYQASENCPGTTKTWGKTCPICFCIECRIWPHNTGHCLYKISVHPICTRMKSIHGSSDAKKITPSFVLKWYSSWISVYPFVKEVFWTAHSFVWILFFSSDQITHTNL